jgi:GT2 family glycosyltransferase
MNEFAGFIMTYERASILEDTLTKIFSQTVAPEKILIIDNSFSDATEKLILSLNNPKVFYHKVGYNSGPAGAAAIGLKLLSDEGYEWIYCGDDDDPPIFQDTFKILLKLAKNNKNCGCVGSVGQFFNKKKAIIERVPNELLQSKGALEVDNIAGGMSKIVNGKMISEYAIFPEKKLFFGLEELDFDMKVKKIGYKLLVDKSLYWKHRVNANRVNFKRKYFIKKNDYLLQRNYYSTRNILYICYVNNFFLSLLFQILKAIFKPVLNINYGFKYFKKTMYINYLALYHFFAGKYGFRKIY